jgi:hypothetical protein
VLAGFAARADWGAASDVPPMEWGLIWSADRYTARVRAFAAAANDLVRDRQGHLG